MNPPLPLVERKRRQARQRIIEAARELFFERGYDGVSVGDIAERAEVGRTTFFRYFGDKQEVVFGKEQELLDTITEAGRADGIPAARTAAEAVEQLRPIVLDLCAQATADPQAYVRHFELIDQHPELLARDAVKMQQFAERLSGVLIRRGSDRATAVFAAQVAIACYQTAKRLSNNPHTLVDETRAAFSLALTLGDGSTKAPRPAPGPSLPEPYTGFAAFRRLSKRRSLSRTGAWLRLADEGDNCPRAAAVGFGEDDGRASKRISMILGSGASAPGCIDARRRVSLGCTT